jgi:hypothetical protein
MRLASIKRGANLKDRALYKFVLLVTKHPIPDVVRVLRYRPDFFGTPFNDLIQDVLRGPSEWSIGERELFAAYVAKTNQCEF